MAPSYDTVRAELLHVESRTHDLYILISRSRSKGLADAVKHLWKTFDELLRERDFLKPSAADSRRAQLHALLRDSDDSLRRLDEFIIRLSDRTGPPPDLHASTDIQEALNKNARDLLHFNLALVSEPTRKPSAILPPNSAPTSPLVEERPNPKTSLDAEIGRNRSVRQTRREKDDGKRPSHRRFPSSGGGVLLAPPINTTAPTPKESALQAPPSPFQATVEEVPDEGTPDEKTAPFVKEYYMTPPNTDEASSSQDTQGHSDASKGSANADARRRRGSGRSPRVQPPSLERGESSSDFLSPHDATRPKKDTMEWPDEKQWQPSGDFDLYGTTDDEFDAAGSRSGSQTPFKVESLSTANTPVDRSQMPSPRPRRSSYTRRPTLSQHSGPEGIKVSPRHSPGYSPGSHSKAYDDSRIQTTDGREKFSPRPSTKEIPQDWASNRRRSATQGTKPAPRSPHQAPYPMDGLFGVNGGDRVFHAKAAVASMSGYAVSPDTRAMDDFFRGSTVEAGRSSAGMFSLPKDESMRVHTGESPKEKPLRSPVSAAPTTLRPDDSMRVHTGESPKDSMQNSMSYSMRDSMRESTGQTPKQASSDTKVTEKELKFALEDIFTGCTKRMVVKDSHADLQKEIVIVIRPGLLAGTRLKYSKLYFDNERAVMDLHFIVAYKPHATFTRHGDDLHMTVEIDLLESLCGWERYVDTICGKRKRVQAIGPTGPHWNDYMAGLGMPRAKNPEERGDLVVGVNIKYPTSLSDEQRDVLKAVLRA